MVSPGRKKMKAEIVIDMRAEREAYKIDMEAERHNAKISIWEERRIMWAQRYGNDSGFDPEAYERHNI